MISVKFDGKCAVSLVDVPQPMPGEGEVLIKAAATALCGSEMHTYRGAGAEKGNIGHEGVGTIVGVGEGVTNLRVGQRVGASAIAGCGQCEFCREGMYTFCSKQKFVCNMHAEYFLGRANACSVLPDDIAWDAGVLLSGDGLGVPFHSAKKLAPGTKTVAVFGCGPIGLGNVLMQAHLGRTVFAVDISPYRRELAKKLGAAHAIDPQDGDAVEKIRAINGGGVDVAFEAAGRPETAKQCFVAVRPMGQIIFNGEQGEVPLSPSRDFIRRDLAAIGSFYYHFNEVPAMFELYRKGLRVSDLITHRFPLKDAAAAFEMFNAGKTGKVLLVSG